MTTDAPEISVVAATHDRPERLRELLASLRAQTLPPDRFEVIIVDDGSGWTTGRILAEERRRSELALRVIRRERPAGPAGARNEGWRAARAPIVAFTDDDCVATPRWLEAALQACARHPGALVQGETRPRPDELRDLGPFSRTHTIDREGPYYQTCNIFYPRDVLSRLGGFDETFSRVFGEDVDLAWRAIRSGVATCFSREARVLHAVNYLGPLGKLRLAASWSDSMLAYRRHPELRARVFVKRVFWKATHYLLARSLIALVLPRRLMLLRRWLAAPYMLHLLGRGPEEGGSRLLAPYFVLHDLIEMVAVLRGGVRCRALFL